VKLLNGNFLELIPHIPSHTRGDPAIVGTVENVQPTPTYYSFSFLPLDSREGFHFEAFDSGHYAVRMLDGHIFEVGRSVSRADWNGRLQPQ